MAELDAPKLDAIDLPAPSLTVQMPTARTVRLATVATVATVATAAKSARTSHFARLGPRAKTRDWIQPGRVG